MCLATVYLENEGQREEVMRDVGWIVPRSGGTELIRFLGESRLLQGKIKSIDLVNSSVVLERVAVDAARMGLDGQRS